MGSGRQIRPRATPKVVAKVVLIEKFLILGAIKPWD
jgi:hypothetical protein